MKANKCERETIYRCTVNGNQWEMCGFCELTWLDPDVCRFAEIGSEGSFCHNPEAIAAADGRLSEGRNNG